MTPVTPTSPSKKPSSRRSTPPPATLSTVVAELQGLRRDMVVLCRVIIEGQKTQTRRVTDLAKRAEQPGSLSANILSPSWFDAIHEANQEMER